MTIIRAMGELRIDFADPNKAVKFLYLSIKLMQKIYRIHFQLIFFHI